MKPLLLALTAAAISAAPLFNHPNYLPALPAPVIESTVELSLPALERENPQWDIYFDGGLVGLFGRIPAAPIWTTERIELREIEHPLLWLWWLNHQDQPDCPPVSTPEPAAMVLVGIGLVVVGYRRRRSL